MASVRVSGPVTNDDQRAYIKIETLRGKTPTEIHTSLMEVCGVETVDRSTISRWAHRFREIEHRERPEERTTPNVDWSPKCGTCAPNPREIPQNDVKKLHILLEFREHLPTVFWLNACTNVELPPGGFRMTCEEEKCRRLEIAERVSARPSTATHQLCTCSVAVFKLPDYTAASRLPVLYPYPYHTQHYIQNGRSFLIIYIYQSTATQDD